ncbi:HTH-type transcriptional regulator CynR [Zhongshania aliphaticivorans]|uniref:HTH-type transcriptional regulator CynR n=1 Tax=Zhongshania aliphaticivorans TaxID=1470434 RepID=A0A5S9PIV8_9GAMM|nr:LysR family transcriptional regulator [Zhongshania aliphaticivorans]CAA0103984.1 HTH-type transcriptional regulator CynR [Zhongshania aliphaticivorans]CAA0104126.1 HTH-type transcriptional regulator CynR [Zhongshania aliphaticivorans]
MINTQWLRSFCQLVEVGSFTRTAEQLHMTQSGVSQHIHKLEDHIGLPLLVRHGKQFTLTDAGERLYTEAREIIQSLAKLEQRISEDPANKGEVRIKSPGSLGLKLYPQLLTLQQQYPQLIIDYRFAPNADVESAIASNEIDIGLMTRTSTLASLDSHSIAKEALLLVTPATLSTPSWEDLCSLGFIDHPDGAHHAGLLLTANYPEYHHSELLNKKGFSNQISLILDPVSRGLGFTVLPAHAVAAFPQQNTIKAHPLHHPVSETIYLGVRRDKPIANRVTTVISEIKKCL